MKNILYWLGASVLAAALYSLIVGVYGCYPRGAPVNVGWAILFFPFNIVTIGLPAFAGGLVLTNILNHRASSGSEHTLRLRSRTAIAIVGCIMLVAFVLVFTRTPDNCVI